MPGHCCCVQSVCQGLRAQTVMHAHSGSMSAARGLPVPRPRAQTAPWGPQPPRQPPHLLTNAQVCGLSVRKTQCARCAAEPAVGAAQISGGGRQQTSSSCCCRRLTAPLSVTCCSWKQCALPGICWCLESAQRAQQAPSLQEVPM